MVSEETNGELELSPPHRSTDWVSVETTWDPEVSSTQQWWGATPYRSQWKPMRECRLLHLLEWSSIPLFLCRNGIRTRQLEHNKCSCINWKSIILSRPKKIAKWMKNTIDIIIEITKTLELLGKYFETATIKYASLSSNGCTPNKF